MYIPLASMGHNQDPLTAFAEQNDMSAFKINFPKAIRNFKDEKRKEECVCVCVCVFFLGFWGRGAFYSLSVSLYIP